MAIMVQILISFKRIQMMKLMPVAANMNHPLRISISSKIIKRNNKTLKKPFTAKKLIYINLKHKPSSHGTHHLIKIMQRKHLNS
jgi:hypothetical protein